VVNFFINNTNLSDTTS